jgi:hypothetical protein
VVVVDGDVYGPGYITEIPDHVAKRITNPLAWGEEVDSDEGHGVPGNHEQLASGLLPHTPLQPDQTVPSEPAGQGGVNPAEPASPDTASSAVPAGGGVPEGGLVATGENTAPAPLAQQETTEEVVVEQTVTEQEVSEEPVEPPAADQFGQALMAEPPRSGKGATTAAWRAYAEQFGVQVDEDADRGAIIAQLKDDGHIQ